MGMLNAEFDRVLVDVAQNHNFLAIGRRGLEYATKPSKAASIDERRHHDEPARGRLGKPCECCRSCKEASRPTKCGRQFFFKVTWNERHSDSQLNRYGIQAHATEMIGAAQNLR